MDLKEPGGSVEKRRSGKEKIFPQLSEGKNLFTEDLAWAWWENRVGDLGRTFSPSSCPATWEIGQQPAAEGVSVGLGLLPGQAGLFPASRPQTGYFLPLRPPGLLPWRE